MAKNSLDLTQERDQQVAARLRSELIIWLSTVRPDGRPQIAAVWFYWDGEYIYIFSIPNNQKVRNLRSNQNVALALEDTKGGDDPITIEGTAELLSDGSVNTTMPAYAEKYAALLASMKWTAETMAKEYSQPIRIKPTRFIAFGLKEGG